MSLPVGSIDVKPFRSFHLIPTLAVRVFNTTFELYEISITYMRNNERVVTKIIAICMKVLLCSSFILHLLTG
jgi:hypothetical protein